MAMRLLAAAVAWLPVLASADASIPGATARPAGAATGGAAAGGGGTTGERNLVGLRAPAPWLAPCAARLQRAAGALPGRTTVAEDAAAETVTLERRCGDGNLRCGQLWAMVSATDPRHGEGRAWTNHKDGYHTFAWDLRRRSLHLEGWVEANGRDAAGALPLLQRAVDECLALDR